MKKIGSIISYSSYHNPYIEDCIYEASLVSDIVVVVASTHFFNGEKDKNLIAERFKNQNIRYVEIDFTKLPQNKPSRFYHNLLRKLGYEDLQQILGYDCDFYFFIDSDEILEGGKVKEWIQSEVAAYENYKLAHFWYYRDTCYRARTPEEGAVLVAKQTLESSEMNWFGERERENYTKKWNYMASYKNKVLGHHYSWAGTEEMLLRKVKSWGHNSDNTNWEKIVVDEFKHEFNGKCPFKSYVFDKIDPYIGFTFEK